MLKQILAAAAITASCFGAFADGDTMYLIKDNHVVGKYHIDEVDYATFTLPEGVSDNNITLEMDDIKKNEVAYTINTVNPLIAYAHNIISDYDAQLTANEVFKASFDLLPDEDKVIVLKYALSQNAYVGIGSQSFKQKDFKDDGTGSANVVNRFSVIPGTKYYLCAWEVDYLDQTPLENFVYTEFSTLAPAKADIDFNCTFSGTTSQYGAQIDFTGSDDVYYVRTCWGARSQMNIYVQVYGLDFLMGTFGQAWNLSFLQGSGDFIDDVPNSTWALNGSGEYVMFARAYNAAGDYKDIRLDVDVEEEIKTKGPDITVISKSKTDGSVSATFEINPSNVTKATVRLLEENDVDDALNSNMKLSEIATAGDATDITETINKFGEYVFSASGLNNEKWYSILVYALDKSGNSTTVRVNVCPFEDTEWSFYPPVYESAETSTPEVKRIRFRSNPTLGHSL